MSKSTYPKRELQVTLATDQEVVYAVHVQALRILPPIGFHYLAVFSWDNIFSVARRGPHRGGSRNQLPRARHQLFPDWQDLCCLSDEELGSYDIAAVNLACAAGLPGSEVIDAAGCINALDRWAIGVGSVTERDIESEFRNNPAKYDYSEPLYRMVKLVLALKDHCGLTYNRAKMGAALDEPFDLDEQFIFGAIQGPGGSCATLPMVFTAVGRRLGYPVKLVQAKGHLFCRWDDPVGGERINIEGANLAGVDTFPDEIYREWPYPITPDEERDFGLLQSMTPRQELASFLDSRCNQWLEHENYRRAIASGLMAWFVDPRIGRSRVANGLGLRWDQKLRARRPRGFPNLEIEVDPARRRWPGIPWEVEQRFRFLEEAERVLDDPELEETCWRPLREGREPSRALPATIVVDCTGEEQCISQP